MQKKEESHPLEDIECEEEKHRIASTLKAIEGYVMCSCIAIGLLQILSVTYSSKMKKIPFRFLRTTSNEIVSEATVACYLRKNIFSVVNKTSKLGVSRIIKKKQADSLFDEDILAS